MSGLHLQMKILVFGGVPAFCRYAIATLHQSVARVLAAPSSLHADLPVTLPLDRSRRSILTSRRAAVYPGRLRYHLCRPDGAAPSIAQFVAFLNFVRGSAIGQSLPFLRRGLVAQVRCSRVTHCTGSGVEADGSQTGCPTGASRFPTSQFYDLDRAPAIERSA